jgi:hypothetical protein
VIIEPNSTKNYELTYLPLTEGKFDWLKKFYSIHLFR